VNVFTGIGNDTTAELYWGRGYTVWNNNGDTAFLRDTENVLIDEYSW